MACGLEARAPLLNLLLLEFAMRLPVNRKLHGLTRRYVFRRAIRSLVPEQVIRRPKKGFNMPVAHWLRGSLREMAGDVLSPERLRRQGLFDPQAVQRCLQEHWAGRRDHRKILWNLLVFQCWHDRYMTGSTLDEPLLTVR
jgi:asparagine synthase (glutamine-hydrolysing)